MLATTGRGHGARDAPRVRWLGGSVSAGADGDGWLVPARLGALIAVAAAALVRLWAGGSASSLLISSVYERLVLGAGR